MSRRKKKMAKGISHVNDVFEERVTFTCPYCGGTVTVADGEKQMVMHSMPPCEKYLQDDVLVFLRNARVKVVGHEPDDAEWPLPPRGEGDN